MYKREYLEVFLEKQSQLFDEPVAETPGEAEAFLSDCMAQVVDSVKEVRDYLEESGMDVSGVAEGRTLGDRRGLSLPDGKILIVEG